MLVAALVTFHSMLTVAVRANTVGMHGERSRREP